MGPSNTCAQTAKSRLTEALLSDKGLSHLIEVAAEELENPVLVVDPTYRYAARAGFALDEGDDSAFARVARAELAEEGILDEGVRYIAEQGLDAELARTRGPVVRRNDVFGLNTMTQAACAHGICLARVMMLERTHAFGPGDEEAFCWLVRLVAQEVQKNGLLSTNDAQAGPYFLARLLDDESPNPMATSRRMALVGFQPLPQLFVVVVRRREGALDAAGARNVRAHLSAFLAHSLSTFYEGELVALVSRRPAPQLPAPDEEALARACAANGLVAGISNAFAEVTDVQSHLRQARSAIRYGSAYTKVMEDTGVYRYSEYTYMEMLDICNDRVNLMNYVHPGVWALHEHDCAHGSELVETLFAYIQNGCNTARTAALLSLHKNTLLYRLGRIKEITGNDLASGEDLFLFHLSIRTLLYLGILEVRVKPRTSEDLHAPKR